MNKKRLIVSLIISLILIFCCSTIHASNLKNTIEDASNKTSSTLKNAEKNVENGVMSAANGIKNVGNSVANGTKDTVNGVANGARNIGDDVGTGVSKVAGDTYTATRTATTGGGNNFLGMSTMTWTWLILSAVTIAIVALVWYYGSQYEHRSYDNND